MVILSYNDILSPSHVGFRPHLNTNLAMASLLKSAYLAVESGDSSLGLFCDFDEVDH